MPTFVSGNAAQTASGTTHRITLPSLTLGQLVIVGVTVDDQTPTLDGALTEISSLNNSSVRTAIGYFISDGTEGGTDIGATTSGGDEGVVGYAVFDDPNSTTVIDVAASTATGASGSLTAAGVTTVTDNAVVCVFGCVDRHRIQTLDGSLSTAWNQAGSVNGNGSSLGYLTQATAGSSGTFTNTLNTSDEEWVTHTFALRPAAGGSSVAPLAFNHLMKMKRT